MATELDEILVKVKDRQWALADIDWEAPGADKITDEQRPKLKAFMSDLVWIEQVGARGFASLALKTDDETMAELYRYFHAEEQRHANAELALMRRWGMLDDDEIPEPNINIRLVIDWLDRYGDDMSLAALGTVIPMLETALDGALLKFLLEEVEDPLCHEVFKHINSDESRHLAVDFAVLEILGVGPMTRLWIQFFGTLVTPATLIGLLVYTPLLSKMRDNIVAMGLSEERLYAAMRRFKNIGDRSETTHRNPIYRFVRWHGDAIIDRGHPIHKIGDPLVALTQYFPKQLLRPTPSWIKELTYRPVAS
jgi:hypothetical protein